MYTNGTVKKSHSGLQDYLGKVFPRNAPPNGWWRDVSAPPEPTLEQILEQQKYQIESDAQHAFQEPVTDANGTPWAGGFDSALKIKAAVDLAEFAGFSGITLYDAEDEEHTVALAQAKQIAALIGGTYQQLLGAEKAALRTLRKIDLNAPDAKEQIEGVRFEVG